LGVTSWRVSVFYDVVEESKLVQIKAIGYKEHNKLFIHGKEFEL
jgi:hypothetical protein